MRLQAMGFTLGFSSFSPVLSGVFSPARNGITNTKHVHLHNTITASIVRHGKDFGTAPAAAKLPTFDMRFADLAWAAFVYTTMNKRSLGENKAKGSTL
jgi:hypothetical protein